MLDKLFEEINEYESQMNQSIKDMFSKYLEKIQKNCSTKIAINDNRYFCLILS